MNIQKIKIERLKPAEYNPRISLKKGDKEYEKLRRSIEEFGYVEPVIWNKRTGSVVGGHQRLTVLKDLGETEVDCVVLDIPLEKEKALNVALNKINGDWDETLLSELMKDLDMSGFDITLTGFDIPELSDMFNEQEKETEEEEIEVNNSVPPITQKGDVWLLGKHKLICGDSLDIEIVEKLMGKRKANLFLTDPPYNVDYKGSAGKIENDNQEDKEFREFLTKAFRNADKIMKAGASFYIWHADSEGYNFRGACRDVGWEVRECLVWNKNSLVLGRQDYHWKHEPCLYGWKDGKYYWGGDRKQTTVLDYDRPKKSELHPTMKPVELFSYQILNSTKPTEVVFDAFAGSGTTVIACEKTKRIARVVELDPKYADVIVKRFKALFPKEKIKLIRNNKEIEYIL